MVTNLALSASGVGMQSARILPEDLYFYTFIFTSSSNTTITKPTIDGSVWASYILLFAYFYFY